MRTSVVAFLILFTCMAFAQESDYDVLQSFEKRSTALQAAMDSATTPQALDALKTQIDALALDFQANRDFLDKALTPDTFEGRIAALRQQYTIAYERTSTIQTQGVRIVELETTIALINSRIDTLTGERNQLFSDLQEEKRNVTSLRETVKRLTANLQANDRLLFSLVDSIFLPYDRNMQGTTDVEKERIAGSVQQANIMTRVYGVAADNVRFLTNTQLQPKDYASLLDQYQAFRARWSGLSEKMKDVVAATARVESGKKSSKKSAVVLPQEGSYVQVDSVMNVWNEKLMHDFWISIEREFTSKGININHFTDGPSFSSAVLALVATYKEGHADVDDFVDGVWRERIDKDWRDALSRDGVLGRTEYATLDKAVSELGQKTVDVKLILYIVGIVVIAFAAWWVLSRKPKTQNPQPPAA